MSVIRFNDNSDTDAKRGEAPGQNISGEAKNGRGIDPITNTRWMQRINRGHEL